MNVFINTIKADKIIYFSSIVSLAIIAITTLPIVLFYKKIPPIIPLYNQMPWGEEQLATTNEIFIPIIIVISIYVLNLFLAQFLYTRAPLISRILSVTTILTVIFVFLLIIRTLILVL